MLRRPVALARKTCRRPALARVEAPLSSTKVLCPRNICYRPVPLRQPIHRPYLHLRAQSYATRAQDLFTWKNWKQMAKRNPYVMTLIIVLPIITVTAVLYSAYDIDRTFEQEIKVFPPEVELSVRKALVHTHFKNDPVKASNAYLEAINLLRQMGYHHTSKEVVLLRLKLAEIGEIFHRPDYAIAALEHLKKDCLERLAENLDEDSTDHKSWLLSMAAKASIKLGGVYGSDALQDSKAAEKHLEQGIEIILREQQRRREAGVEGNAKDDWFDSQEVGASFEQFANFYEERSRHDIAAPLYLQALMQSPKSCHAIVLMNNLAQSLAQTKPGSDVDWVVAREALVDSARQWAQKALVTASEIKPPARNEECDISCAVATHNLGEFAEMQEMYSEALKRYAEAESLAKAIKFEEGIKHAREGMERIKKLRAG